MPAPKGNQFWKLVKKPTGRPRKFSSPEDMWEKACEYFAWCDENPLITEELESSTKDVKEKIKEYQRVYTISGLRLYLGISEQSFLDYEKKPEYEEFSGVVKQIKDIIYTQKFEGATAGLFNSNIIARDLGLADKKEVDANVEQKNVNVMKIGGIEIEIE